MNTGVLLINLGTPDSPSVKDVRKYLFEFLSDPKVMDIGWLKRKLLVNLIIVPSRAPKSAKIYQELWTEKGSPLLYHGKKAKEKLQESLGKNFHVELAMRYQNPSLKSVLGKMEKMNFSKLIVLPLFPQYADASTGSAIEKAISIINKWKEIPEIKIIEKFYDDDGFINAFAEKGRQHDLSEYDHVLFSFHGLPVRQINKGHKNGNCETHCCKTEINSGNKLCYLAGSYVTARSIAEKLGISKKKYTVCFQSRLGNDPWIEPFSDVVIEQLAKNGIKKLLVFSPAFVADCLETTIEIAQEYKDLFIENGGEKLQLVESLNDHPMWIDALVNLVKSTSIVAHNP